MTSGGSNSPAGDDDRESALHVLGEHLSEGTLTIDEYGERCDLATSATTRRELLALFDDLAEPRPYFDDTGSAFPHAVRAESMPLVSDPSRRWNPPRISPLVALLPLFPIISLTIAVATREWWIATLGFGLTTLLASGRLATRGRYPTE